MEKPLVVPEAVVAVPVLVIMLMMAAAAAAAAKVVKAETVVMLGEVAEVHSVWHFHR